MKLIILAPLLFLAATCAQQSKDDLYGKWLLVKVEVNSETLNPTQEFFLTISEDRLAFNRDVNNCSAEPIITVSTIEFDRELCTRACCDGRHDPIGGLDLYRGKYIVTDSTLTIEGEGLTSYLKLVTKE